MYQSHKKQMRIHVDALWAILENVEEEYDVCTMKGVWQGMGTMNHDVVQMQKELIMLHNYVVKVLRVFE